MKIIDLLNKIANGEIDRNTKYQFSRDDYCTINDFFARYIVDEENLNLEILEEEKKIPEKLGITYIKKINDDAFISERFSQAEQKIIDTLNDVIDYLKNKGE